MSDQPTFTLRSVPVARSGDWVQVAAMPCCDGLRLFTVREGLAAEHPGRIICVLAEDAARELVRQLQEAMSNPTVDTRLPVATMTLERERD